MQLYKPGQRWYSSAEPELGLGTLLRADNRQVDIIFTDSGELKQYTQQNAPLIRCIFEVGDEIQISQNSFRINRVETDNALCMYQCGDQSIHEGLLDSEQTQKPAAIRLLVNECDSNDLYELRRNALCISHLSLVEFEHFAIALLQNYAGIIQPQSEHSFRLECSNFTQPHLLLPHQENPLFHFENSDSEIIENAELLNPHHALVQKLCQHYSNTAQGSASFLIDDQLPARSAVLQTIYECVDSRICEISVDVKGNELLDYTPSEMARYRAKDRQIDLKPFKRSIETILPELLLLSAEKANTQTSGKLLALRLIVGTEFASLSKAKR